VVPLRTVFVAVAGAGATFSLVRDARRRSVADRFRTRSGGWSLPGAVRGPFVRALHNAAVASAPEQVVEIWLLAGAIATMIGFGLGPAAGLVAAVGVLAAGPVALRVLRHRRDHLVAAAVPDTLEQVGAALRAGETIATSLAGIGRGDGALAADMARVQARVGLGSSLPAAIQAWARERRAFGADATAGALALSATLGGPAADALDGLASSLRDRLSVFAEARALSAQARYSAWVIGLAPIAYVASSAVVDPRSIHLLLGTGAGRVCVVLGLGLEVLGAVWIRAIVRTGDDA
jgi:tight adherence protein B